MIPVVSVSCCTYNQEKYICNCLESLINQKTTFPFQVIVHDDASTDSTPQIIKKYEREYPGIIKGIYQKKNQFSIHPMRINQFIFPMLTGKYVAFCEGDDYWCDNEKLQKQYDAMERNPDCSICVHKVEMIYANGASSGKYIQTLDFTPGKIIGEEYIKHLLGNSENLFQTSSFFIKRNILLSIPENMKNSFYVGDMPIILWSAENGNVLFLDYVGSCYRLMSQGSTNQALRNRKYAMMRVKTSLDGRLAFNAETDGKYWECMKHGIYLSKAQLYYGDKSTMSLDEKNQVLSELTYIERLIAKIKFTRVGNILRNTAALMRMLRI